MSELIDENHRRRARKRLLSELLLESEWLMHRLPSRGETPLFPTAAPFFGCAPLLYSKGVGPTAAATTEENVKLNESRQLYKLAGPACVLSATQSTSFERGKQLAFPAPSTSLINEGTSTTARQRVRHHWASLCRAQTLFGDDIDRGGNFNPQNAVITEQGGDQPDSALQWLHNPFTSLNPTTTILAATRFSPTASTTVRILGDAAPLSPVVQPYPYFSRRNRRRACPFHSHLDRPGGANATIDSASPETKAYRAAWDREEPLTLPPTCSCNAEALTSRYLQLVKRLVDLITARVNPSQSTPVPTEPTSIQTSPESTEASLLREAEELLEQQSDCSVCGGLQYFPYSFIEAPLTREASSLLDFCERVPLPPRTEVFCDGPKVTACIISKSPKHEWEIYKALYAAKEHSHAVIYDVCTSHYFPGYKPLKMYWSRSLVKSSPQVHSATNMSVSPLPEVNSPSTMVNSPRSATAVTENVTSAMDEDSSTNEPESAIQKAWRVLVPSFQHSPLRPPQQCPLNLSRCEAHPLYTPMTALSLTTPDLRRVYCISCRSLPALFNPADHISAMECESIEQAHRKRIYFGEGMELHDQITNLRRENVLAEHKLTLLRQQAWGYRLSSPEFPIISQSKAPRVQAVVPLRPCAQSRRDTQAPSERSASRDVRRSPSAGRTSSSRDHRPSSGAQTQSTKNRLGPPGGGGSEMSRRPGGGESASLPRYPPNAHSSAAASRIHALRAGTNSSQSHNERR